MWDRRLNRRSFVAASVVVCFTGPGLRAAYAGTGRRLRVFLAVPGGRPGLADGATIGIEEVRRTFALVGASIDTEPLGGQPREVGRSDDGPSAVVGGHDAASAREIAALAERAGIPFLNVGAPEDALRVELCAPTTFHVAPSDAMIADALRFAVTGPAAPGRAAVAWHESLTRFGAEQLNDRFRARFGRGMTADGWCSWMALKTLGEAALRAGEPSGAGLAAWLRSRRARFDGHKGVALSFRSWSGQLRQPLYVLGADGRVAAEVPGAARDDGRAPAERLDDLGAGDRTRHCVAPPVR